MERLSEAGWCFAKKLGTNQGVALGVSRSSRGGLLMLVTALAVSGEAAGQQQQEQDSADSTADESDPAGESSSDSDSTQPEQDTSDSAEEGSGDRAEAEGPETSEPETSEIPEQIANPAAEGGEPSEEAHASDDALDDASPSDDTPAEEPEYFTDPAPFSPTLSPEEGDWVPPKPPYMGPFRKGLINLGISIGYQSSATHSWFVPGVSVGYFLVNGLQIHLDTDFWIGDPFVATPSPGVRFVFFMLPVVNPYVGAFYRHYFVASGFDDDDSVGGRAGVNILTGQRSYFGGGVVYERMLRGTIFANQNLIYPEIQFAFSF